MSQIQNAVAKREDGPQAMIEKYSTDFEKVLPSHIKPATWIRLAQGTVRRNDDLREAAKANPGSFLAALLDAARQGLEPGTEQYYLTPRKVKGKLEVLGITGYQGLIELMYRAGAVSSVVAEVVRDKDGFRYQPGTNPVPIHDIDWNLADRGELRLVYGYAIMKDGAYSRVVVLNAAHIAKIKTSSTGSDSPYSPWTKWEESMWLKSAIRQLSKWVPTSAEYIREQLRAIRDVAAEAPPSVAGPSMAATPTSDFLDGELVDMDPVTGEVPAEWPPVAPPGGAE